MDWTLVTSTFSSLKAAKEIGEGALALRDFNQASIAIAKINEQLLKAQESLFTHNSQLMELQQQYFEAREELRKLKETKSERERYALFELSTNNLVYRVNLPRKRAGPASQAPRSRCTISASLASTRGSKPCSSRHPTSGRSASTAPSAKPNSSPATSCRTRP